MRRFDTGYKDGFLFYYSVLLRLFGGFDLEPKLQFLEIGA